LDPTVDYGLPARVVETVLPMAVVTDKMGVRWLRYSVVTTLLVDSLNELSRLVEVHNEKLIRDAQVANANFEEKIELLEQSDRRIESAMEEHTASVAAGTVQARNELEEFVTGLTNTLTEKLEKLSSVMVKDLSTKASTEEVKELNSKAEALEDTLASKTATLEATKCSTAEVDGLQVRTDRLEKSMEGIDALQNRLDKLEAEAASLRRTLEDERHTHELEIKKIRADLELQVTQSAPSSEADDESVQTFALFSEKLAELKRNWEDSLNPSMPSSQRTKQWNSVKDSKRAEAFKAVEDYMDDMAAFKKLWGKKKKK